jgi:hypothetical protein
MALLLPSFNTKIQEFSLLQSKWAAILNPILGKAQVQSSILKEVTLQSGLNSVNHLLGRDLQGWKIVRQRASASIYDTQDACTMPDKVLQLVSSALCVCDIEVF